jgi:carbonic anhydrase/acetyltransferase-like protein (isoleucine patch superfamily)
MPLFSFEGAAPTVHPTAWIAPTATLVGDVRVEAEASVWYGVTLRADFGPIVVGAGANVQDNSVVHGGVEPTVIGPGATIGHLCMIHGATIGAEALIGNGATVLDGAVIGARALVGAGSLVPPNVEIAPGVLAMGVPARDRGPLPDGAAFWVTGNPGAYRELARRHAAGVHPIPEGDHPQV